MSTQHSGGLYRHIGGLALLFMALGGMIGSGWLFAGMYAAKFAGPAAIISWVIGAVIMGVIALTFAELGSVLPIAGGLSRYPHITFGGTVSFICSWVCWLGYVAVAPIETMAILEYLGNLLPWLTIVHDGTRSLSPPGTGIAAGILLLLTIINTFGVRWLAESNKWITWWKIAIPIGTAAVLIGYGFNADNFTSHEFAPNGITGIFAAVSLGGVALSLLGFRLAIEMAGESRNPQRDVPRAIIGSIIIATGIYILLQIAFIGVVPSEQLAHGGWEKVVFASPSGPFAAFAAALGLQWLAVVLYIDSTVSPFGTALIYTTGTSRMLMAMSRNRNIPAWFGRIAKRGIPLNALIVNLVVGWILLSPLPAWSLLAGIIASSTMLAGGIGTLGLGVLRRRYPELPRPFRLPCGMFLCLLGFAFSTLVIYWAGWSANAPILIVLLIGLGLLAITASNLNIKIADLHLRCAVWLVPHLSVLFLASWLSEYSGGIGVIPSPWGDAGMLAWGFLMGWIAIRYSLPRSKSLPLMAEAFEEVKDAHGGESLIDAMESGL
ncbi:MAG: APC family permease [Phycisphaerales bacterium]|jgi:amino acid transporter|nr:APC family permease [Phycisphaerales bacterium]MDP6890871.1 APC family permease [Phycisphaerales bacterium]